jgi:Domain of unknown function (DUF4190)
MDQTITPPGLPPRPKTSALAVWSLVLGILSVAVPCMAILAAIPAVICGHTGMSRIRNSGGALTGNGLALAGLITGYIGIFFGIFVFGFLAAIAVPNFEKARHQSMENACINNLRQIQAAKQEWALEKNKSQGDVPTEFDLTPYLANNKFPVCPADGNYTIGAVSNLPTCSVPGHVMRQ